MRPPLAILVVGLGLAAASCGSPAHRDALRADLDRVDPRFEIASPDAERPRPAFDGQLASYLTHAVRQSPTLQARYAAWRAAVEKTSAADKLPEPVLTYGLFLRRVETRVGAQRQRFGARFTLPWPSKLSANADAAAFEARAAGHRFDAEVLAIERRVGEAYWDLWVIGQNRAIMRDQLAVLQQLSGAIRNRLEIGRASVADLSQIELAISRLADDIDGLDALETQARARLLKAVGAPLDSPAPIDADAFRPARPTETPKTLRAEARAHPTGQALTLLAEARRAKAQRADSDRYPDLTFGVDYTDTAEIEGVDIPDNGKDPIVASIGVSLPIWTDAYGAGASAARAEGLVFEHQQAAVADDMEAQVVQALSRIRDSNRRLALFESTLIPQAETTFGSAIGSYEADGSAFPTILLAYRDLNALRLDLVKIQAGHAMAWVWLKSVVGRTVGSEATP